MAASSFALGDGTTSPEAVQRLEEQQRVYLSTVANLQIDSLVKDLNRIRFAFHATNSVRFEHFATVFRTLKATKLFQGYVSFYNLLISIIAPRVVTRLSCTYV